MPERPPIPRSTIVIAGAIAIALALWPDDPGWRAVAGDPLGEVNNHLWMFWRGLARWGSGLGDVANAPAGVGIPLMDPVNLPIFALGGVADPALGWSLLRVFNLGLAAAGGYALARCFVGPAPAVVGMVAATTAPFLAGVMDFGLTESWPVGWLGLHAALLIRHARSGRVSTAVLAGLCLGLMALSGWYHAFFALVAEAVLVPVLLWRHRRWGTVLQGGIALVMTAPAFLHFLEHRDTWAGRFRDVPPGPPGPRADWHELPVYGGDALALVLPHPAPVSPSASTYLGIAVLLLILLGVARAWRRAWLPVVIAAALVVLSLGLWPTVGGVALGLPGPAWWLSTWIPSLTGLSHWHRAVGPAVPFLAAAAAVGASVVVRGQSWRAFGLAALVAVDHLAGGATAWPRTTAPLDAPPVLMGLSGPGDVIQIPFDNGRRPFSEEPARLYNRWQVVHGRGVSENYEGVDALLATSALVAAADAACWVKSTLPPYHQPPPEMRNLDFPTGDEVAAELVRLRSWGYRWIVLHRSRCRMPAKLIQGLEVALGPGEELPDGDRVWALASPTDGGDGAR